MKNKNLKIRIMSMIMAGAMLFSVVAGVIIYLLRSGHVH